jgi:hypothetical protein
MMKITGKFRYLGNVDIEMHYSLNPDSKTKQNRLILSLPDDAEVKAKNFYLFNSPSEEEIKTTYADEYYEYIPLSYFQKLLELNSNTENNLTIDTVNHLYYDDIVRLFNKKEG